VQHTQKDQTSDKMGKRQTHEWFQMVACTHSLQVILSSLGFAKVHWLASWLVHLLSVLCFKNALRTKSRKISLLKLREI